MTKQANFSLSELLISPKNKAKSLNRRKIQVYGEKSSRIVEKASHISEGIFTQKESLIEML